MNNVFSRYSNPTANTWTDTAVDFAMEVLSQAGGTVNVSFYVGNPLAASPSKPQFVQAATPLQRKRLSRGLPTWSRM